MTISSSTVNNGLNVGSQPQAKQKQTTNEIVAAPKQYASLNHIPSDETIATGVRSAAESRRNGVVWDRGSILNVLT